MLQTAFLSSFTTNHLSSYFHGWFKPLPHTWQPLSPIRSFQLTEQHYLDTIDFSSPTNPPSLPPPPPPSYSTQLLNMATELLSNHQPKPQPAVSSLSPNHTQPKLVPFVMQDMPINEVPTTPSVILSLTLICSSHSFTVTNTSLSIVLTCKISTGLSSFLPAFNTDLSHNSKDLMAAFLLSHSLGPIRLEFYSSHFRQYHA
jgi:hypothetical protein